MVALRAMGFSLGNFLCGNSTLIAVVRRKKGGVNLEAEIFLGDLYINFITVDFGLDQDRTTADRAVFGIGLGLRGIDQNGDAFPAEGAGNLFFVEMHGWPSALLCLF